MIFRMELKNVDETKVKMIFNIIKIILDFYCAEDKVGKLLYIVDSNEF